MNNEFGISDKRCGHGDRDGFSFVGTLNAVNNTPRDTGPADGYAPAGWSTHLQSAELIRCLRAQTDHLKGRVAALEHDLAEERDWRDTLREDNISLRAMVRGAYEKLGYKAQP